MKNKFVTGLFIIGIPVIYALLVRLIFGTQLSSWDGIFSVMSISFLFLLPTIIGALTVYLSKIDLARSYTYQIFIPWIPIFFFLIITIALDIEGWACWIMILPVFLLTASIGGLIGGYIKRNRKKNRLNISLLVLLPFFISPMENLIEKIPGTYTAYTYIDIKAPAEKIWNNVVRVKEIPYSMDKGYLTRFLGFPRPVKAELNFNGVGAYREAIFTKGLVFHETVIEYVDLQKMVFTIKAYPYEIPSTTLDQHVVIGGDYFDVLNGTYALEKLAKGFYRLHLYSHFKINTTFNFYAGWWAKWIMKDIQNNILQVEKIRAEKP